MIHTKKDAKTGTGREKKPKMYFLKIPDYFSYDICTNSGLLNQLPEENLRCHQNSETHGSHRKQVCGAGCRSKSKFSVKENKF